MSVANDIAHAKALADKAHGVDPLEPFLALSEDTDIKTLETTLRALIPALSVMDEIERAATRARILEKKFKIKGYVSLINAVFNEIKSNGKTDALQGQEIKFEDLEPWSEAVDSQLLFDEISEFVKQHVVLDPLALTAITLWIVHTWCLDATDFSPILGIRSPQMRCGKSTLLRVLQELSCKAYKSASASVPALFRMVEEQQPTLLVDELDSFLKDNEELRGLLNEGVERSGTFTRLVGEDHKPRAFKVFCPKALAQIGNFPGTVEDRAIPVLMKRKKKDEKTVRFQKKKLESQTLELRRKLLRWATDNLNTLADDPSLPESLNDRQADCWRPLIAIANHVGGTWANQASEAAEKVYAETSNVTSSPLATQLLIDLKEYFADKDKALTKQVIEHLVGLEGRPWADYRRGNKITYRQLASLLKPYDVHPKDIRIDEKTGKGYELSDLQDSFMRYIPASLSATARQSNSDAGFMGVLQARQDPSVADEKSEENRCKQRLVADVADKNAKIAQVEDEDTHWEEQEPPEEPAEERWLTLEDYRQIDEVLKLFPGSELISIIKN